MSSIITISREFRADVLRGDKAMLRQLSSAYATIEKSLKLQLDSLMREIAEAQREGKTVNRDWLRRSFRYQQLIRQVKAEVQSFANGANGLIQAKQLELIGLGQMHATDLIEAALPGTSFFKLPTGAIEELVGVLADGSPLSKLLDKLGPQAAKGVKEALIEGLGSGYGAAKIARAIRQVIDMPRWRALTIARTETLRAFKSSSLAVYRENSDILSGWRWLSTLSVRTCSACWSLHGKFFPLSKEFFPGHVNCRCTSIPEIRGAESTMQLGSDLFAALPVEQQITILGPGKWEMYSSGTPLTAFTVLTRDPDWGPSYQVRLLYQLKKRKAA